MRPFRPRVVGVLLRKEFRQILRNRGILPIIILMPILQLLLLPLAATFELKEVGYTVVDEDQTMTSRRLADMFDAGGYFHRHDERTTAAEADSDLALGRVSMIVHVPAGFERALQHDGSAGLRLVIDAQDGAMAGVINAYASNIIDDFGRDVQREYLRLTRNHEPVRIIPANWFNPSLDYQTYMVPGILVLLVTIIGMFLTSMNIVREKEVGTIEQLNVTPLRKTEFIAGKLIPFWVIALLELAVGLGVAWLVFRTPVQGSLLLVFALAALYLVVILAAGLWISAITDTQQQAMFIAWFFMVIFILMSGLFTPIESMPLWAQKLALLNPVAHFIEIMRRVLLKGAGLDAVLPQFRALVAFAVVLLTLAVRRHRKVAA